MLINLSSQNETNPAQFTNHLSDALEIKPFSYICLVKGQVFRTKEQKQIAIPPDTVMFVRWTAYDVGTLTLNSGGASDLIFTVAGLVQYVNGMWGQLGFPAGYVLELIHNDPVGVGNDERVEFKFLANVFEEGVVDFRWKDEVYAAYGGQAYWTTKFGQCRDNGGNLIAFAPNPNVVGEPLHALYSQQAAMALGAIWDDSTRTAPPNQTNGTSFGMLTTEVLPPTRQNGYTPMQFFINQQNVNLTVAFGVSTSAGALPVYSTGPYIGNNNYAPNHVVKSNILALEFDMTTQGRLDNKVFNDDTNQVETNTVDYDPGDYFEMYPLVDHEGAIDMVDPQRAFYMNVNHYKTGGLILAYQGNLGSINDRPGSNNFFLSANTTQPTTGANVMNNMCHAYDLEHLKNKYYKQDPTNVLEFLAQWQSDMGFNLPNGGASWLTNSVLGSRVWTGRKGQAGASPTGAGWVYNQSLGRPATQPFLMSYEDTHSNYVQWRYSTGVWGFLNHNGAQRPVGSAVELPNTFRVMTTPLPMVAPTFIACSFNFNASATAMIPADQDANIRTLIGGDAGVKLLEIQLNQANTALPAGWDIRVTQADGTTLTATLEDDGANRINFRGSDNANGYTYNFLFTYTGTNNNTLQCQVIQCVKNAGGSAITSFQITGGGSLTTTQALMPFNSIGGINPLTDTNLNNYNDYSPLTYIANVRIYQKNRRTANSNSTWNIERASMMGAFGVMPSYASVFDWWEPNIADKYPGSISFYPYAVSNFVVPTVAQGTQDQYNNVGFPNSTENLGVFISKGAAAVTEPTAPVLNNLYVPAGQILQNDRRTINLSADAYAGIGIGLVDVDLPDTRSIGDVLEFELPEPDANDNILQVPRVLPANPVPPNDWIARITADADVSIVENEQMNVEITNLPHISFNATNGSMDKTIYQLPMIQYTEEVGNQELVEMTPPSKVWIPFNNPGSLPLNKLDVKISAVDGRPITTLLKDTHITLQIENEKALLN